MKLVFSFIHAFSDTPKMRGVPKQELVLPTTTTIFTFPAALVAPRAKLLRHPLLLVTSSSHSNLILTCSLFSSCKEECNPRYFIGLYTLVQLHALH